MTIFSSSASAGTACGACKNGSVEPFAFSMAFQPIVDTATQTVFAYEALARGPRGESAHSVLSKVTEENRYAFDQSCRVKAISLASRLGISRQGAKLSVNFMPGAVYSPAACIQQTLRAARENNFPLKNLIFEITEDERVQDTGHLQAIVSEYKKHGFTIALDDFGAGYSGLNLLAELDFDELKLDVRLVRNIHQHARAEAIVRSVAEMCRDLGVRIIAEAVETAEEYAFLHTNGITLMQGYFFARPQFEALPEIVWPKILNAVSLPARHGTDSLTV